MSSLNENNLDMEIGNCSVEDLEMEMEKMTIDEYFEEVNMKYVKSLYELLKIYLQNTKISNLKDKHYNLKTFLFTEKIDNILYRGHIRFNYMDCSKFKNLGNCLYITHIMIYPRRGNFFKSTLKKILYENDNIDTIFIEAIMSEKVLKSFEDDKWIITDNSAFITKLV